MRFGRLGIYGLSSLNGVTDDAGYADGAKHVQLVRVEKNVGLDGGWRLTVVAKAVSADAVLHPGNTLFRPTLGPQNLSGNVGGLMMVVGAFFASRITALDVMQQGGSVHDLQAGVFGQRQAFCHAVNPFNVVKPVHRVGVWVPVTGGFQSWQCWLR